MEPHERFDEQLTTFIEEVANFDLASDDATTAMKNLKTFSECRPPLPEPEPIPAHVPETRRERAMAKAAAILDNETTRTIIKAAGALGGVVFVTWSTVHRDHVLERQALSQANQRIS